MTLLYMIRHSITARRLGLLLLCGFVGLAAWSACAQNITLVGEINPFTAVTMQYGDVWAEGDLACLGVYSPYTAGYGVGIFSITNPANPVLLGNYFPSPAANNQFEAGVVRNKIGYFASNSGSGGLHIVSLTNPAAPAFLSRITGNVTGTVTNGFNAVHTLFLDQTYLYLADSRTRTVKVFNVADPAAPVFLRNIVTSDSTFIHQVTVISNRLYTSGWGGHTDIYDVSNIGAQAPPLLGIVNSGGQSHTSWPTEDGRYLVSARESATDGDVRIFDISTPSTAVLVAQLTPGGVGIEKAIPHIPAIVGNLLYVAWYRAGLQVFNISNPTMPIRVGSYDTIPTATQTYQGNWGVWPFLGINKILLSDMQRGLLIVDASGVAGVTNPIPIVTSQPHDQSVSPGSNATFTVNVLGAVPMVFQWRFNDGNISGATNATFIRTNAQLSDAGSYSVFVTNIAGTVLSSNASLSIILPRPMIQSIAITGTNSVRITWSAVSNATYQLQYNENLALSNWSNLGGPVTASGSTASATDNVEGVQRRFYRVAVPP